MRIGLAASAGGHLTQLQELSACWDGKDVFYVTTKEERREQLEQLGRTYVVGECNRQHPIRILNVLCQCLKIVHRERPDVVISTGAAPALLICLWAKLLFKTKVIWIDSIANVERLSLSGRIIKPFADLLLTQWPGISQKDKKAEYVGALL